MSGVCGAERISRSDVESVLNDYGNNVLKHISGYVTYIISGSYNSDLSKQDFGDIDIIVCFKGDDKKSIKQDICKHMKTLSNDIIVPFKSEKYKGKKLYNSGEIVTINYKQPKGTVQIDNIIATSMFESEYKKHFLDLPAEKQGLLLGLIKVAYLEDNSIVDKRRFPLNDNETYEYNISSVELQLRAVVEEDMGDKIVQISKRILWSTQHWRAVLSIIKDYDLDLSFEELLEQIKTNIKTTRSLERIVGIFKSMITVKSGEVGTEKGNRKLYAIECVEKLI